MDRNFESFSYFDENYFGHVYGTDDLRPLKDLYEFREEDFPTLAESLKNIKPDNSISESSVVSPQDAVEEKEELLIDFADNEIVSNVPEDKRESILRTLDAVDDYDSGSSFTSSFEDDSDDNEWKPPKYKEKAKIDFDNVIDINVRSKPLFEPKDFIEESDDYEDSISSDEYQKPSEIKFSAASSNSIPSKSTAKKSINNVASSHPRNSKKSKLIVSAFHNTEAKGLIKELVQHFTNNSKLDHSHKKALNYYLRTQLTQILSDALTECTNVVFNEVLENLNTGALVHKSERKKTKDVACQTIVTGDVLSQELLIDGKDHRGKKVEQIKEEHSKANLNLETIINMLNERLLESCMCTK